MTTQSKMLELYECSGYNTLEGLRPQKTFVKGNSNDLFLNSCLLQVYTIQTNEMGGGMEEGESDYSIVHLGKGAFPNSWRTGVLFRLKALRMCNLCNANDGKTGDETTTKRGIL